MAISMLDASRTVPLLTTRPATSSAVLDRAELEAMARRSGVALAGELPDALLALRGRDKDTLPNGCHVGIYKDALYADRQVRRAPHGRCPRRLLCGRDGNARPARSVAGESASIEQGILAALPQSFRPHRLVLWRYGTVSLRHDA